MHHGLVMGSLVIMHVGSYMPHGIKDVCSAGFMIYSKNSRLRAKGVVVQRSTDVDNYRSEILDGIMIQLVLRAASRFRHSLYAPVSVLSGKFGVVTYANAPHCALKEKQPQVDAL